MKLKETEMRSQVESGAELLARLENRPSLRGLEDNLFLVEPQNAEIMEICGERSTGKTLLLSQIIAKCILPNYYRTIRIDGCNASAILINTDHHFRPTKLIELMSDIVTASTSSETSETNFDAMVIIENSLRNLHVINCYNSEQLFLTIRALDETFLNDTKIALVAIDSITAYYWQDRESNVTTINNYVKKLLNVIKMRTSRFNIVTIYTRLYECDTDNECKSQFADSLDYKVQLSKISNSQSLLCTVKTRPIIKQMCYSISSNGIKWQTDERQG